MSTLRCTLPNRVLVAKPRSRRVVVVKALSLQEATNMVAQAFVRIFSVSDGRQRPACSRPGQALVIALGTRCCAILVTVIPIIEHG